MPKPKVAVQEQSKTPAAAEPSAAKPAPAVSAEPAKAPVHELTPNVPVVPVTAKTDGSAPASKAVKPAASAKPGSGSKQEAAKRKSVAASKKVLKETSLGNAKLDLSLPPDLAEELQPAGTTKINSRKPLLPPMFGDKDESSDGGPFELNGRILSNEMQLQMRNDNRRDVEGAALDFKFRQ